MKIALYGRPTEHTAFEKLREFLVFLNDKNIEYAVYETYAEALADQDAFADASDLLARRFNETENLAQFDFWYSIGGDGTILDSVRLIGRAGVPIVGVNVGRLGFLAPIGQHELAFITTELLDSAWRIEERALVEIESWPQPLFGAYNYGMNEVSVLKSASNEMIVVQAFVNGEFMNSYWADGLIISTPSGSTAYSLACGGPIIAPQVQAFVITPVAPHALTVRPIVIPDSAVISLEIASRSGEALIAIDNRTALTSSHIEIAIKKADFSARLVKLASHSYFETLRTRLIWGMDSRN